jgi:2-C-methyl-D-erythritol 2,4-cyclodiphosphate synthase
MPIRVGQGFDVHPFSGDPGRVLVLGGVRFDGERGLDGHSDADVVAHACADAILGGAGLGDIGQHFPSSDPRWEGADSVDLLARAASMVRDARWDIGNVDCTVVCEHPKLSARRVEMQDRLSAAVGAPVSVKASTTDGLGMLGRREGIACLAVAVLVQ